MMKQAAKKAHPLLNESSPFAIREAFNHLRVNLNYATDTSGCCPVYAITSAAEKVGKVPLSRTWLSLTHKPANTSC